MTLQRFVVIESTPGYMPEDDDPFTTYDYAAAVDYLNDRCKQYEDDESGVFAVEYGIASAGNYAAAIIHDSSKSHDLGRTISIEQDESEDVDVWTFIEEAPSYVSATADLWYWSTNYDAGRGPITLFLDLIGWSEDNIGEPLYSLEAAALGYVELAKLAAALNEYAERPQDVRTWIDELCSMDES